MATRQNWNMARCAYASAAALASVGACVQAQTPDVLSALSQRGEARQPDYANAQEKPLPINLSYSRQTLRRDVAAALESDGQREQNAPSRPSPGDGRLPKKSTKLPMAKTKASAPKEEDFGTASLAYSTARADLEPAATNTQWPYRAAGKLFFMDGPDSYVCSASLIDRGLVVTAAHCVAEYGAKRMFSDWRFIPGYRNGDAPFGNWVVQKAYVLAGYPDGTAPCDAGVVCRDDIALLVLKPQMDEKSNRYFVGQRTGWFSHISGTQPYAAGGLTHVTQLGYPTCLDNGAFMQRNDAQAVTSTNNRDNTVMGSLMCGGSSGGPIVVNFGVKPTLTKTIDGRFGAPNVVIGVTSWGSQDPQVKQQGASPFLSTNIDFLVKAACKEYPDACSP